MLYFNFHHHHTNTSHGIYNVDLFAEAAPVPFSAGIHPNYISDNMAAALAWLKEITKHPNCLAIGECGLDARSVAENEVQQEIFKLQIDLANERKKPLIIHCVKKHYELIPFRKWSKVPMIIHGFRKNKETAKALLEHNFYLSFGKALLQSVSLQEILKEIAPERFFLETDNEDIDVFELYLLAAKLKNVSPENLETQMQKNLELITK